MRCRNKEFDFSCVLAREERTAEKVADTVETVVLFHSSRPFDVRAGPNWAVVAAGTAEGGVEDGAIFAANSRPILSFNHWKTQHRK